MGKLFAIGDIHGCYKKLRILLEKVNIDFRHDTLIFMGDYIDRGPLSFEVVEYLIKLKKKHENIIFLRGNHEEMLLKYLAGHDRYVYLSNGGQQTLESYLKRSYDVDTGPIPQDHIEFLKSLDLYFQTDDFIFVHAGLKEGICLEDQVSEDLLWIRRSFVKSKYDFGKCIIFGHTPFSKPLVEPNKIGIDTGAVFGNKLTCIELPTKKFYNV